MRRKNKCFSENYKGISSARIEPAIGLPYPIHAPRKAGNADYLNDGNIDTFEVEQGGKVIIRAKKKQ